MKEEVLSYKESFDKIALELLFLQLEMMNHMQSAVKTGI